jgi:hypothetical protein
MSPRVFLSGDPRDGGEAATERNAEAGLDRGPRESKLR